MPRSVVRHSSAISASVASMPWAAAAWPRPRGCTWRGRSAGTRRPPAVGERRGRRGERGARTCDARTARAAARAACRGERVARDEPPREARQAPRPAGRSQLPRIGDAANGRTRVTHSRSETSSTCATMNATIRRRSSIVAALRETRTPTSARASATRRRRCRRSDGDVEVPHAAAPAYQDGAPRRPLRTPRVRQNPTDRIASRMRSALSAQAATSASFIGTSSGASTPRALTMHGTDRQTSSTCPR